MTACRSSLSKLIVNFDLHRPVGTFGPGALVSLVPSFAKATEDEAGGFNKRTVYYQHVHQLVLDYSTKTK